MDGGGNMIQAEAVEDLYRALIQRLEVGEQCLYYIVCSMNIHLHLSLSLSLSLSALEHGASPVYSGGPGGWW